MDIQQRLQQAVDNEMFLSGGERDLLVDSLHEITRLRGLVDEWRREVATVRRISATKWLLENGK